MNDRIIIKGAKENNLKNIDLEIPRNKLVVFTGLSGSGKTSLAFDTLFAEGQRRYMESLSSYARQFLGQMQKPDVELIEGLSPSIAIDQKTTSSNPRSTVGTVTEINDYLRLLFANAGQPYCINCNTPIESQSVDKIVEKVMGHKDEKILVIAPVVRGKKGEYVKLFESFQKAGYVRVKVDGRVSAIDEVAELEKNKKHDIYVVVDRLVVRDEIKSRLTESVETAISLANGLVVIDFDGKDQLFSTNHSCPDCGFAFDEISPRMFSFNTPYGACPNCGGLGFEREIDEDLVLPNKDLSINDGAISVMGWTDGSGFAQMYYKALAKRYNFSLDTPIKDLPREIISILLYGSNDETFDFNYQSKSFKGHYKGKFEGIIPNIERKYNDTASEYSKTEYEKYMVFKTCSVCNGKRLNKQALAVKIGDKNIADVSDMSVVELSKWLDSVQFGKQKQQIAGPIIKEIKARVKFLVDVGLGYLSLSRNAGTLSGGEAQRIRLATQIGSGLTGVLYILDEPSIGLHPKDTEKLLTTLRNLRDKGNSIIVVEHDEDTIRSADFIVDVGPKAGVHGGQIVATGSVADIEKCEKSITGQYLSGARKILVPQKRRETEHGWLNLFGCKTNNLKNIDVSFPLGVLTAVTGVSGSGKSSLVNDILYPALANRLNRARLQEGDYDKLEGENQLDKVVVIDQSPIGKTPRSNPATYTGLFSTVRELFASTPDARAKGYGPGRFSFNVRGGRCEHCGGDGVLKIEMHFLPDVYVTCEECHGKRYSSETLSILYKGASIADVLDMTVEKAVKFFENVPSLKNKLQTLYDVGLGYIKLGQPATTLSGGEAQRVKLATELSKRATGKTMYILDEPTTGLHTYDVEKLIGILQKLVSGGNSVVVIEHNLDLIKVADHIIDLGPDGGDRGGKIVATGTPEDIAAVKSSKTGEFVKPLL